MDLVIAAFTCLITIVLAFVVLLRLPKSSYARYFFLMCVAIIGWIAFNYITNHAYNDLWLANLTNKLAFVFGYMVILCGLLFTYKFPVARRISRNERLFLSALTLLMMAAAWWEPVVGRAVYVEGQLTFVTGIVVWIYVIGFLLPLGLIVKNLVVSRSHSTTRQRTQAWFVLTAFVVSAVLGLLLNVIVPAIAQEWHTTRLGPLVVLGLVGIISYAIVRHSLFDIRLAVIRSIAYGATLGTLAVFYYIFAFTLSQVFVESQAAIQPTNIVIALLLAFLFQPVKAFFDRVTDTVFFRKTYGTADFIGQLSRTLTSTMDVKELLERSVGEISNHLRAEQGFFVVRDADGSYIAAGTPRHKTLSDHDREMINAYVQHHGQALIATTQLSEKASIRRLFERNRIGIVLPLGVGENLLGYLVLGEHRSGGYVARDLRVLTAVADELFIAIQNTVSARELSELNTSLQQRIDEATKELRHSNDKLRQLDEAKDEFISMASHQLRTPLTSVKGYLDMVLEGDAGTVTDNQRKLLSEAFDSSERMVHIINDFLNVSRLQTGKFVLEPTPIDLSEIIAQEVKSLASSAKSHNLKLRYKAPKHFPVLEIDEGKIRQVIMNFIDNAIYYSPASTTVEIVLEQHAGEVVFEVHDHGMGVPKSEQKGLFTKFFRATNARKQRPDGTGVGLFLAKKVIDAHHGQIIFFSKEGKGSVFGFRLAVKKLQTHETNNTANK